jgi:hypothetical protein
MRMHHAIYSNSIMGSGVADFNLSIPMVGRVFYASQRRIEDRKSTQLLIKSKSPKTPSPLIAVALSKIIVKALLKCSKQLLDVNSTWCSNYE